MIIGNRNASRTISRVKPITCKKVHCTIISLLFLLCKSIAFTIPSLKYYSKPSSSGPGKGILRSQAGTVHFAKPASLIDEISTDIENLPIYSILDSIRESINDKPNLLLEAAPGAGKTTIVPLLLSSFVPSDDNKKGGSRTNVIVVEPRRVATRSAAQRMAKLIDQSAGGSIGYAMRGESKQSSKTQVTVMTDGILLNKLRDDPELDGIDVVILDEFHERGVGADTALALLREVQMNYRPDLKLVVMSATLLGDVDNSGDAENTGTKLMRVLGGSDTCNILRSDGRQFPITIQHAKRSSPLHGALLNDSKLLINTMLDAIEEGLLRAPSKGDVLAFLPGAKEIRKVVQQVRSRGFDIDVFPLYGALPKADQDKAIYKGESDRRRIIVSSPIAEASLTIEGVTCVVDSGFRREPRYDANTGLPRLVTVSCSKDSAIQRAGRAGRTEDGYCVRLFSEGEFVRLSDHALPEIASTDLVPTALLLSEWGCTSANEILENMPFVDPPPKDALNKAHQMLVDLEALEEYKVPNTREKKYRVTGHGQALVRLPTHPRFATSIIKAAELGKVPLAAAVTTAALLDEEIIGRQESNLALRIKDILHDGPSSMNGKKIVNYASRISADARSAVLDTMMGDIPISQVSDYAGQALLPGFIDLVAQHKGDASYGGSTYMLSLGCSARLDSKRDEGDYIIVVDTSTGDDGKTRIRAYSRIDISALQEVAVEKEEFYTVASKGYRVRARKVSKVGSLVLSSSPLPSPSPDVVADVLLEAIDSLGGIPALIPMQSKKDVAAIVELRQRIRLARKLSSDDDWPPCFACLDAIQNGSGTAEDEETLISLVEPWLAAAGSIKGMDMLNILLSSLCIEQQNRIDIEFPTKIEAPDGSSIPLKYQVGTAPVASGKLQQFFGATENPVLGPPHNTTPVSLSLLSPSGKQLAQTIDLPFFWKETYPSVRAEMRGRYPKHPWPEDPMAATATRLTKKQQAIKSPDDDGKKVDKRKERGMQRKKKR
jgi:ATP-dependent helicase HrpB